MDCEDHLIGGGVVSKGLVLVAQPQELGFSVAAADVCAELDKGCINGAFHRVRLFGIAGALDGDRSLIVGIGGRTPRTVFLLHIKADTTIAVDAVVRGCLRGGPSKPVTKPLRSTVAHNTMRGNTVDGVSTLARAVGTQACVIDHTAVCICHHASPSFSERSWSCSTTAFFSPLSFVDRNIILLER